MHDDSALPERRQRRRLPLRKIALAVLGGLLLIRIVAFVVGSQDESGSSSEVAVVEAAEADVTPASELTVTHVVDGDTVDVSTGERIRLIGIDTPERGECGYEEATERVEQLVAGAEITLAAGAQDDTDRYGRLLRYVEADGVDVGQALIDEGLAISRYDSSDGYGSHPKEDAYQRSDEATEEQCPT